ncbi:hypothetical protein [Ktedonospora formicarum]|uniref:hypothetical protein n=1 Tax=Ktedonospora formicarum TaxID=2778364 RepID=UPI001C68A2AE|nr:hypothetical protein [Ktedonospora formicarum]
MNNYPQENPQYPQQPAYGQPYPQQGSLPNYPPQPGMMPPPYPPQQPPKKKGRGWLIGCGVLVVVLVACGIIGAFVMRSGSTTASSNKSTATTPSTDQATATTKATSWKTTHEFSGNGTKKTEEFTVSDTWKIKWTCNGGDYGAVFFVNVYADGTLSDSAVNAQCKAGKPTEDETIEHRGGKVYLDINAGVEWSIEVQEQV